MKHILFYGCEICGFENDDIIEKIYLRFYKMLLKLSSTTLTEFYGIRWSRKISSDYRYQNKNDLKLGWNIEWQWCIVFLSRQVVWHASLRCIFNENYGTELNKTSGYRPGPPVCYDLSKLMFTFKDKQYITKKEPNSSKDIKVILKSLVMGTTLKDHPPKLITSPVFSPFYSVLMTPLAIAFILFFH